MTKYFTESNTKLNTKVNSPIHADEKKSIFIIKIIQTNLIRIGF